VVLERLRQEDHEFEASMFWKRIRHNERIISLRFQKATKIVKNHRPNLGEDSSQRGWAFCSRVLFFLPEILRTWRALFRVMAIEGQEERHWSLGPLGVRLNTLQMSKTNPRGDSYFANDASLLWYLCL
jgi:hypothetical protein